MDDIRRMLDRLPELSDDELGTLEESIIQEFGVVEQQEISSDTVAEMTFLADSVESVRSELGKRDSERSSLAAQAAEAAARVTAEPALEEAQTDESASDEGSSEPPEEFSAVEAATTEVVAEDAAEASAAEPAAAEAAIIEPPAAEAAVAEVPETETPGTEAAAAEAPEASTAVADPVAAAGVIPVIDEEDLLDEEPVEVAVEPPLDEVPLAPEEEAVVEEAIGEAVDQALTDLVDEGTVPVEEGAAPVVDEVVLPEEEEGDEEEEAVFAAESAEASVTDAAPTDGAVPTESVEAPMGNTTAGPTTFSAPADRLPSVRETVESAPITLIAGGDIPGITAGSSLNGAKGLSEAMQLRLHTLRRASGGRGDQVVVASLIAQFPEDRTLRGNELDSNSDKIKAVTNPHAVVASGGWCAPLPVNYDIFDIGGSTDTPVKDSLPTFTADRGGVRYIVPPVLDDYVGAVGIWTNADDIAAAPPATTPRKACLTVACAAEQEVYLDAVTTCLCFGNLQTRAFPELIDRHNQLALVEAARFSEIYILNKIKAASTAVTLPAVLGAARDVLISVERAAVAYRHQHRLDPDLPLRFIAPQWLHAMVRSDLTAQLPGDGMDTTFNLANATIDGFFNARNIRPVWSLDGVGDLPTVTDYPDRVEWALFSEGTFTLLDGGTLDIGLVRDMELVSTNDYCMFTEQFLAVAKTGLDSLWVTQTFNVNGGSAGTLDVASVDY